MIVLLGIMILVAVGILFGARTAAKLFLWAVGLAALAFGGIVVWVLTH